MQKVQHTRNQLKKKTAQRNAATIVHTEKTTCTARVERANCQENVKLQGPVFFVGGRLEDRNQIVRAGPNSGERVCVRRERRRTDA